MKDQSSVGRIPLLCNTIRDQVQPIQTIRLVGREVRLQLGHAGERIVGGLWDFGFHDGDGQW